MSLFAGLLPIPGGIGVSEAGLTLGLTAIGIDNETAFAIALAYRVASFYLPPVWGSCATGASSSAAICSAGTAGYSTTSIAVTCSSTTPAVIAAIVRGVRRPARSGGAVGAGAARRPRI